MSFTFEISTKNLSEASKIKCHDEFCFFFDDTKITCHKLIAAFISPKVCKMLISDPTIDKYYLKSPVSQSQDHEYKERISQILDELIHFYRVDLESKEVEQMKEEIKSISQYCKESDVQSTKLYSILSIIEQLGNDELLISIYHQLFESIFTTSNPNDEKTSDQSNDKIELINMMSRMNNVIDFVRKGKKDNFLNERENYISEFLGDKYIEMIDNVSDEFYKIDDENLKEVDENILRDILHSKSLKIINEDWLIEKLINRQQFIEEQKTKLNENEISFSCEFFFDEVRFEFLSSESIQKFIENLSEDEIDRNLWRQIKKRLVLPVMNEQINEREMNGKSSSSMQNKSKFSYECTYNQGREFEGILKHLTDTTNGNIHSNGTTEITTSYLCCGDVANIVDYNNLNSYAHVYGSPSPRWLQIDFKTRQIQMTSYVINTGNYNSGVSNKSPKSWKVEISNDGSSWEVADERNDVSEIKENNKIKQFEVNPTSPFRYMRIITDKDNHRNSDGFVIGNIEIYGGILKE